MGRDVDGHWQVTAVVKATFTWDEQRRAVPVAPLPIVDELAANRADELCASHTVVDLGPPKPRVDVLIVGALAFPVPVRQVEVTLVVGSRLRKVVRVLDEPTATPSTSWAIRPSPNGFGPQLAHWPQRARLAGTYDDEWRASRWPLPPEDFELTFLNVAPRDQQLDDYLPGEEVGLTYMTVVGHDHFLLPAFEIPVTVVTVEDLIEDVATVDTIIIEPTERRFSLVARAAARLHPTAASLRKIIVGAARPAVSAPSTPSAEMSS
jgi:hypothetical protein